MWVRRRRAGVAAGSLLDGLWSDTHLCRRRALSTTCGGARRRRSYWRRSAGAVGRQAILMACRWHPESLKAWWLQSEGRGQQRASTKSLTEQRFRRASPRTHSLLIEPRLSSLLARVCVLPRDVQPVGGEMFPRAVSLRSHHRKAELLFGAPAHPTYLHRRAESSSSVTHASWVRSDVPAQT